MNRLRLLLLCLLLGTAMTRLSAAHAQRSGDIEIGGFGSLTRYDQVLPYESTIGAGGRLNLFLIRYLAIEGEVLYTETVDATHAVLSHAAARGRLLFDVNPIPWTVFRRLHFLVGAGVVHNEYRLESRGADTGPSALAGLRITLFPAISLRTDVIADHLPSTVLLGETSDKVTQWTFQAGLSFHLRFRNGSDYHGRPQEN